uniref:Uncharacterized protein n=1 Tax=Panagrolaimus davidi TaxID=227884 RepID=A0A914Q1G6_9BILA
MTAEVLESAIQVIDSCQNFMNGITTLETSTETTYELYKAEQEKSKQHFHQMRIELATQTSEIVNAVLRRMNDCALTIESYENRYNQVFEETTKEYNVKKDKMKDLKQTCSNISENNPQTDFMPHLADVSSKLSEEVSAFTNQMVLSLRELFHPPKLSTDIGSILNVLNTSTKFTIRGHVFSPVYRTNPTLNIIDVPILKLAENPITEIAGNQKPGEKRSAGPIFDAIAAKKSRNEMNGPSVAEIAGTKITHPTFENATLQNSLYSQVPSHIIHPSNISYAEARTERPILPRPTIKMPSVAQGYSRRGAPVISFKNCGPISIVHQQQPQQSFKPIQPQQQSFKPIQPQQQFKPIRPNTVRNVNRAVAPPPYNPPSYGIQVSSVFVPQQQQQAQINYDQNNSINQRLPVHLQIRPKPLTRIIHCPPRVNMLNNGNNIIRLPKVPVVPDLKKGSESVSFII